MKSLIYAAIALTGVAGAAPAMAQAVQPTTSMTRASTATSTAPPTGRWMLLQGYGNHGAIDFTWYYVTPPDFGRYHGS